MRTANGTGNARSINSTASPAIARVGGGATSNTGSYSANSTTTSTAGPDVACYLYR